MAWRTTRRFRTNAPQNFDFHTVHDVVLGHPGVCEHAVGREAPRRVDDEQLVDQADRVVRNLRELGAVDGVGRPSAPSIPPPSRSGAQSTSRSSRSIADSRISRDRSPILRCGSAHTLLLSPCRRRRVPNLLIMFFNLLLPSEIHCDVRLAGIDAMWSLASKFRSRGG